MAGPPCCLLPGALAACQETDLTKVSFVKNRRNTLETFTSRSERSGLAGREEATKRTGTVTWDDANRCAQLH